MAQMLFLEVCVPLEWTPPAKQQAINDMLSWKEWAIGNCPQAPRLS